MLVSHNKFSFNHSSYTLRMVNGSKRELKPIPHGSRQGRQRIGQGERPSSLRGGRGGGGWAGGDWCSEWTTWTQLSAVTFIDGVLHIHTVSLWPCKQRIGDPAERLVCILLEPSAIDCVIWWYLFCCTILYYGCVVCRNSCDTFTWVFTFMWYFHVILMWYMLNAYPYLFCFSKTMLCFYLPK